MEQSWLFNLLNSAKEEIKQLRAENSIMSARLQMFDDMMSLLNAQKLQQGRGMAPDIVYDIEKVIAEFDDGGKDRQFKQTDTSTDAFMEGSLAYPSK